MMIFEQYLEPPSSHISLLPELGGESEMTHSVCPYLLSCNISQYVESLSLFPKIHQTAPLLPVHYLTVASVLSGTARNTVAFDMV